MRTLANVWLKISVSLTGCNVSEKYGAERLLRCFVADDGVMVSQNHRYNN